MTQNLSIITHNVGRSRAQQSELIKTLNYDFLAIPEPLVNKKNNKLTENNPEYHSICQEDIAILYKKNIPIQIVKVDSFYIAFVFSNYLLIACYLAPSKNLHDQLTTISFVLSEFRSYKKILVGDFNVRSPIYEKLERSDYCMNQRAESFEEFLLSHDLIVKNPYNLKTFRNHNGSSVIDLIVVHHSISNKIENIRIEDSTLSNHSQIIFELKVDDLDRITEIMYRLNETKFKNKLEEEKDRMRELVEEISKCKTITQLDEKINNFNDFLTLLGDQCREKIQNKEKSWWNKELDTLKNCIKNLKKRTDFLLKKTVRATTEKSKYKNLIAHQVAKETLNEIIQEYKKLILESKINDWKRMVLETTLWGSPYKMVVNKFKKLELPALQNEGKYLITDSEKYNYLINEFFPVVDDDFPCLQNDIELDVDCKVLHTIIMNLKNKKANGYDKISNRMIKILHKFDNKALHTIFSKCLELVHFPHAWKKGKLKILNKPGKNPVNAKALRPLTLLPVLGKILEKIIKFHLERVLAGNHMLNDNQFAYRKGVGTEHAVTQLMKYIKEYKKRNRHVVIYSFDISGAFDKVSWSSIHQSLTSNIVPNALINIIRSFLVNRTIGHYDNNGGLITNRQLYCGVPQGSVLGPCLFNVVMSNVHKIAYNKDINLISYADDVILVAGINQNEDLQIRQINETVLTINTSLNSARLTFNSQKTQCILFSNKKDRTQIKDKLESKIMINGEKINIQSFIKYLGVIIDDQLNFGKHIEYITSKIMKYFNLFRALYGNKYGLNFKSRKILYQAIFLAITSYCSTTYFPNLNKTQIRKLKSLQRKILISVASGYKTISFTAIHVITGEMPIEIKLGLINKRKNYKIEINKTREKKSEKEIKTQLNALTNDLTEEALDIWQETYEKSKTGRHTYAIIPDLRVLYKSKEWYVNYYITQALTGHGLFSSYLFKLGLTDTTNCKECGKEEGLAIHCLFECKKHKELRKKFSINNMDDTKIVNRQAMRKILLYLQEIMKSKIISEKTVKNSETT